MHKSVEGIYRNGKVELAEVPTDVRDETRVIVTFLDLRPIDLRARGIDEAQAADLRARLATFAEDWDSPEMDIYDDYDIAKAHLRSRIESRGEKKKNLDPGAGIKANQVPFIGSLLAFLCCSSLTFAPANR